MTEDQIVNATLAGVVALWLVCFVALSVYSARRRRRERRVFEDEMEALQAMLDGQMAGYHWLCGYCRAAVPWRQIHRCGLGADYRPEKVA